ncbi:hypothetical protein [Gordonia sp. NB41Y]|uniref:hypothetical protein n=1 Tax=Gordonia sp. NB41Y TaxID=875808 RepID=UPI001364900E|nr:hypothetical protein [Gordonia sp. NB41Y]WLP92123.1 hypothetical protein Q9K23_07795 [Gordonia sp. NB41Y]
MSALVVLPIVSSRFGADGWSALGVGQAVGALAGVAIALAWPIVGAQLTAVSTRKDEQIEIARSSFSSRFGVLVVIAPVAVLISMMIVPNYQISAGMYSVFFAANGLTFSWYYAGSEQPFLLLRNEAIPRLIGYLAGAGIIIAGGALWCFSACMVAVSIVIIILNVSSTVGISHVRTILPNREDFKVVRRQSFGGISRTIGALGMYSGAVVVGIANPAVLPLYTATDQLQRAVVNLGSAGPQALAGWAGRRSRSQFTLVVAVRNAWAISFAMALLLICGWVLAGNLVLTLLFSGKVELTLLELFCSGICFAVICSSQSVALLCMVPLKLQRVVYLASAVCAVLSVIGALFGAVFWDYIGAVSGLSSGFVVLLIWYSVVIFLSIRSVRREGAKT